MSNLKLHLVESASGVWLSRYRRLLLLGGFMATHQSTGMPSAFRHWGPSPALQDEAQPFCASIK